MARYSYTVIYENNRGEKINLTKLPYAINIQPLLDYSWAYATRDRRRGSRVAGFNKAVATKEITLHVLGESVKKRDEAIDAFNNIIEVDIYDGVAGKIWFDEWYTYGYIVSAKNENWQYDKGVVKKQIQLVREEETWYHVIIQKSYTDKEVTEPPIVGQARTDQSVLYEPYVDGIKSYEQNPDTLEIGYDYPYEYELDTDSQIDIVNPNPLGCNFIIDISGPVTDPYIKIGETRINVNVDVPDGAYLTVDSGAKTIIMTMPDGQQINCFGARNPDYYIFQLIESGQNTIVWDGTFSWTLQMIEERSEPRWHTD